MEAFRLDGPPFGLSHLRFGLSSQLSKTASAGTQLPAAPVAKEQPSANLALPDCAYTNARRAPATLQASPAPARRARIAPTPPLAPAPSDSAGPGSFPGTSG